MAASQVVARFQDGRMVKGVTSNFLPAREGFHVQTPEGEVVALVQSDLKALYFVRDLAGDPTRRVSNCFDPTRPVAGRRIQVVFEDGEVMAGTTQGYQPNRPGFFVFPVDTSCNNERCFVIAKATRRVTLL
jgi:hypothetical protein